MVTLALQSSTTPTTPKKHTMLPFLIVLFLVSYGLLAVLVVEQDRTITAQRSLIQQTMQDSVELTTLKSKLHMRPGAHGPSSQEKGSVKTRKLVPLKPPKDAADTPDSRRIPVSI